MLRRAGRIGRAGTRLMTLCGLAACFAGCKVLTLDEDRLIRSRHTAGFDATAYVDGLWAGRAMPDLGRRAVPAAILLAALAVDPDRAGARYGRRTGEGSPWTFVVDATGRVASLDTASRHGTATLVLDGPAQGRSAAIQIGPIVSGTAIRDALPFVTFNDFADQLAFADVGRALTRRAMARVAPAVAAMLPGKRVHVLGVANVGDDGGPLVLTPIAITPLDAGRH